MYFILFIGSLFSCSSSKPKKPRKSKRVSREKKNINSKKNEHNKLLTYSATQPGKTEILLNAQPQDLEKYINDKEGGDALLEEVAKGLEKKKQEQCDMKKYKHWVDYIEEKQQP